jgi:hypothetical protein
VGVAFALFAAVYAFLWLRDRDLSIGWFGPSWVITGGWFAGTPYQHIQETYFVEDWGTPLVFAVFVTLTFGMVYHVEAPPAMRPRLLAIVLAAGSLYWVAPLLVAFGGLEIRRSVANPPITLWYLALGGVAWRASRREPGAGHRFVALTL